MHEVLKAIAPEIRKWGFKGSGQNFRRLDGDFIQVINLQGSRSSDSFYVNLGAQPIFMLDVRGQAPDARSLKEYECMLRRRVGPDGAAWPAKMTDDEVATFLSVVSEMQLSFFGAMQRFRSALEVDPPEKLLREFSEGMTQAEATLYLANACLVVGHSAKAKEMAELGLRWAAGAHVLEAELAKVIVRGEAK